MDVKSTADIKISQGQLANPDSRALLRFSFTIWSARLRHLGTLVDYQMLPFEDWPLWAQVALVVPAATAYITLYFIAVLIKECCHDRRARTRREYHGLGGTNMV